MQCIHSGLPHRHTVLRVHKLLPHAPWLLRPFLVPPSLSHFFFQHESVWICGAITVNVRLSEPLSVLEGCVCPWASLENEE